MLEQGVKSYVCINCGSSVSQLYRKYSNTLKCTNCDRCDKIADKYIEFESVIVLVDAVLLSKEAYRHILYNRSFKLHWKLSLVLLLLESFALWRSTFIQSNFMYEKGFYFSCLQNIIDYKLDTISLFVVTLAYDRQMVMKTGLRMFAMTLLKAVTIANYSKILLLPIMVWHVNTTEFGLRLHYFLVVSHHLFSLSFVYTVVSGMRTLPTAIIVLIIYTIKNSFKSNIFNWIENLF